MAHEDSIGVLGAVRLMAANQRDAMFSAKPGVEVRDDFCKEGTSRIRVDGVVRDERTVVLEEHSGDGEGSVVPNSVGLRKFCVVFNDEEESNVAIFIGGSDSNMINADGSLVVHKCVGNSGMRYTLRRTAIFLTLWAF